MDTCVQEHKTAFPQKGSAEARSPLVFSCMEQFGCTVWVDVTSASSSSSILGFPWQSLSPPVLCQGPWEGDMFPKQRCLPCHHSPCALCPYAQEGTERMGTPACPTSCLSVVPVPGQLGCDSSPLSPGPAALLPEPCPWAEPSCLSRKLALVTPGLLAEVLAPGNVLGF